MSTPDIIEVVVEAPISLIEVEVQAPITVVEVEVPGSQGPAGPKGDPGIVRSATPPSSPVENDLWVDIS